MTFRRGHAVAALLTIAQTTIQAKDPRELTLELLSDRAGWSNLKMASRSGARYECSAGEARLASQVATKKTEDKRIKIRSKEISNTYEYVKES